MCKRKMREGELLDLRGESTKLVRRDIEGLEVAQTTYFRGQDA